MNNKRRFGRVGRMAVVILTGITGLEAVCRYGLQLGDPPLVVRDPLCGYRFAPSQSVQRFGNTVSYDDRSARGNGVEPNATEAFRVLIMGDSVVNGGALTDDADTANGLLNDLGFRLGGQRLSFRSVSAGSWAPPQQLGYLRAYGTADANAIVLVLSSHDALGRHEGTVSPFPSQKPWLAAEELVLRYVLQQKQHFFDSGDGWEATAANVPNEIANAADPTAVSLWCLDQICGFCKDNQLPLTFVLWPTRKEAVAGAWDRLHDAITSVLSKNAMICIDLLADVRMQRDFANRLYRDDIHPTIAGQRVLAGGILQATTAFSGVVSEERRSASEPLWP